MQQILNYTPKVERIHHQYQGQGEVNKTLLYEDFFEKTEEAKDKVVKTEPSEEKLIQNEKEGSASGYTPQR
jgi:predicted glycosyltransferase